VCYDAAELPSQQTQEEVRSTSSVELFKGDVERFSSNRQPLRVYRVIINMRQSFADSLPYCLARRTRRLKTCNHCV
jgi:hypothetical protein